MRSFQLEQTTHSCWTLTYDVLLKIVVVAYAIATIFHYFIGKIVIKYIKNCIKGIDLL